jgi:hypothetical protein
VDAKQADAIAKLMTALDKEENAAIQIGSLLLVKVDKNYVVRNFSWLIWRTIPNSSRTRPPSSASSKS